MAFIQIPVNVGYTVPISDISTDDGERIVNFGCDMLKSYKNVLQSYTPSSNTIQSESYHKQIEELKEIHKQELDDQRDSLLSRLDPIANLCSPNVVKKGQIGEGLVRHIITEAFPECIIQDVSKGGHCADIRVIIDNVRFMIEVKNKATVTLDDVNKFKRDVFENTECIDCALFISIVSPSIPGIGTFDIVMDGKLMVYMYMTNANMVKYTMNMMKKICISPTRPKSDHLKDLMTKTYHDIEKSSAKIHKLKLIIGQMSRLVNDTECLINNTLENMAIENITAVDEVKVDNDHITALALYYKNNNKLPDSTTIQQLLGITKVEIKEMGGIRNIHKAIKDRQ